MARRCDPPSRASAAQSGLPRSEAKWSIGATNSFGARVDSDVEYDNHFSAGPHVVAVFVIPPLSESPEEVLSYVCPASQFSQINIECRMVLR